MIWWRENSLIYQIRWIDAQHSISICYIKTSLLSLSTAPKTAAIFLSLVHIVSQANLVSEKEKERKLQTLQHSSKIPNTFCQKLFSFRRQNLGAVLTISFIDYSHQFQSSDSEVIYKSHKSKSILVQATWGKEREKRKKKPRKKHHQVPLFLISHAPTNTEIKLLLLREVISFRGLFI